MSGARPILIVGLPRSGTTWTLRALARAPGTSAVLEPDSEDKNPGAIHAKAEVGRYPVLAPGDSAPGAYHRLWEWVLNGAPETRRSALARRLLGPGKVGRVHEGRLDPLTWLAGTIAREPRVPVDNVWARFIAKSIHAQLAVEWLAEEFDFDVVVLLRHPANVLASWMEVNLKDARNSTLETRLDIRSRYVEPWGVPLPGDDPLEQMSWRVGLLTAVLEDAHRRHPEWHLRIHEDLCADTVTGFRRLYADLGLEWGTSAEEFLVGHDRPGSGFAIDRVASELSDSWQQRLDDRQVATLRRVLDWFPISSWNSEDFVRRGS
jgi:hypothetical protein